MQSNEGAGLFIRPVRLDHLARVRKPLSAVSLDEKTSLVTVQCWLNDIDAVDLSSDRIG